MKKLFFIYTNPKFYTALYSPVMERAFGQNSEVEVFFLCDNSILMDALNNDLTVNEQVETRLERLVDNCMDAGADCIVVGCTVMNVAVERIQARKSIPIMSIDAPMIAKLVKDGVGRAAVVSHALDNAQTITRQLYKYQIQTELFVVEGAGKAYQSGDSGLLARLYQKKVNEIAEDYDAVVLGHISADDVDFGEYNGIVFRSGRICIDAVKKALDMRGM